MQDCNGGTHTGFGVTGDRDRHAVGRDEEHRATALVAAYRDACRAPSPTEPSLVVQALQGLGVPLGEALAIRLRTKPDDWSRFNDECLLGWKTGWNCMFFDLGPKVACMCLLPPVGGLLWRGWRRWRAPVA